MVSKIKLVKCRFLGETSGGGFDNKKRFLLGCKKSLSLMRKAFFIIVCMNQLCLITLPIVFGAIPAAFDSSVSICIASA